MPEVPKKYDPVIRVPASFVVAVLVGVISLLGGGVVAVKQSSAPLSAEEIRECRTALELAEDALKLAETANENAATVLHVRRQHGEQIKELTKQINNESTRITASFSASAGVKSELQGKLDDLRVLVYERTANRFDSDDARDMEKEILDQFETRFNNLVERAAGHERRMTIIEKDMQAQDNEIDILFRRADENGNRWIQSPQREN